MQRRCYLTVMWHADNGVVIVHVQEHYEGQVNGQFVVSGDTWNEVYRDLLEMGYLK